MTPKGRGKWPWFAVIPALLLVACEKKAPPAPKPLPQAEVIHAIQQDIPTYLYYPANTQSIEQVDIVARTRGFVESIHYTDGQFVHAGEPLYTLEVIYDEANVEQAQAALDIATAKVVRTKLSLERQERLLVQKLTSKEDRDKARLDYQSAVAEKNHALALRDQAKQELSYTHIKSPIDGRISRTLFYPGELVDPDGTSGSTLLTQVVKLAPLYVNFPIPSNDLQTLLAAQRIQNIKLPVRFTLSSDTPLHTFGSLEFIDNTADLATGTILLRAIVSNFDLTILPGQFGHIHVQTGIVKNAILIPTETIQEDFNGHFVYILNKDNTLARKNIKRIQSIDAWTQTEGIEPGTPILAGGLAIVHPGLKVSQKLAEPPPLPLVAAPMKETKPKGKQ